MFRVLFDIEDLLKASSCLGGLTPARLPECQAPAVGSASEKFMPKLTKKQRRAIYDSTGGYCHLCRVKVAWTNYGRHDERGG